MGPPNAYQTKSNPAFSLFLQTLDTNSSNNNNQNGVNWLMGPPNAT